MSIFEDVLEIHYEIGTHRDYVRGACEFDTLLDALRAVDETAPAAISVDALDAVVVIDRASAEEISDNLGDDVYVTLQGEHVDREFVDLVPRRIEQTLPDKAQVHTVNTDTRFGLVMVPHCVTYANTIADPSGVVGIEWEKYADE